MNGHNGNIKIENLFLVLISPQRIALMFLLALLATGHFALAQAAEPDTAKFNHMNTGFNLTGAHLQVRCESCHIQGVFKGTPRDCSSCHMPGNRMGATAKPNQHVSTNAQCDTCHRTTAWTPASFSHVGVMPGSCSTCHNGAMAITKPVGHILTTESCDKCHRTTAWVPAGYNHAGVAPGTCTTCHGVTATGKPNGHVSTTDSCDKCHSTAAWLPASYNHVGVVLGTCATCHGITATGKPNGHIPTTASCDSCHTTTTWLGATFNHAGVVPGTCSTCHNFVGTVNGVVGKTANHIPTTGANTWPSCDSCHKSTTSFTNAKLHSSVTVTKGTCTQCHERGNPYGLTGRPSSNHSGSAAAPNSCDNSGCHTTSTFSK
jgi:hypothetical protein